MSGLKVRFGLFYLGKVMKSNKLSKTDYILGLQCPLALWFKYYRKDLKPSITEEQQVLFDTGHEIGAYANQYFAPGFKVCASYCELEEGLKQTKEAIIKGEETIFEAVVQASNGTYSRIDILRKNPDADGWDLIEVKSSTERKDYHLDDISFQYYVFKNAGYQVRDCYLMLVNNEYVRNGEIDPKQLLKLELVTDKAIEKYSTVETVSTNLMRVLESNTPPKQNIGAHCNTPFECDYRHHCWKHVPEYSVFNIFNKKKAEELYKVYGANIANLPEERWPTGAKGKDALDFLKDEERVDKKAIHGFLQTLKYPFYFLDYETFSHAVPVLDGTRPYQQVPFQFSLHIQQSSNGELKHIEFLHCEKSDPRPAFAKALVEFCGEKGSVIVYNQIFEKGRNKELQETFPYLAGRISNISERIVDLLLPFKNRHIYSPKQNSSASLKVTLPIFTNLSYDNMKVGDALTASRMYLNYQRGMLSEVEMESMFKNLSTYCKQDTLAMVELLEVLKRKISK